MFGQRPMLARRVLIALPFLLAAVAWADDLTPVVVASIHDEPRDGFGDYLNGSPFEGLLRAVSSREDRAIQEYDVSAYAGMTVTSATISGTIFNNNAGGTWPRAFDFLVYEGNGQADVTDFEIPSTGFGTAYWPGPTPPLSFSFDVTTHVQALLDGGAQYVGLKVVGVSDNLFPSILDDDSALLTIEAVPAVPGDVDGDGDVDLSDLGALLAAYGYCDGHPRYNPAADFDGNGCIELADLAILLANYGTGT